MRRFFPILLSVAIVPLLALAEPVPAPQLLLLGPLPAPPNGDLDARVHATRELVPEVDLSWLPAAGDKVAMGVETRAWRAVDAVADTVALSEAGVWWLAARLVADRWSEVTVSAGDSATVWIDGAESSGATAFSTGAAFVFARLEVSEKSTVTVTAEGDAGLVWDLEPRLDFSRFDRARTLTTLGSLAVAPRGKLIARHRSRRNPTGDGRRGEVSVFDNRGKIVAADLGGPDARPVAFSPDGETLLLRRRGEEGTDLLLWTAPRGPMRTVVTDEPGLGLVRFDPSGQRLLMATTRGLDTDDPSGDQRRWDTLRERVPDWDPRPHLHVVDLATGVRRVLTSPGDNTLDDAAWFPGGKSVVYARTIPDDLRPWFHTEIRILDLARGDDRLVTTLASGWEVRPQSLTPHPDGKAVALIGPPEAIGDGRPEHNVYNKQLWSLDLDTGELARITHGLRYAFDGARGLPAWADGGRRLLAAANAGGRDVIVSLERRDGSWHAKELATEGETARAWALSPDAEALAYVGSGPSTPRELWLQDLGRGARSIEVPDPDLTRRFALAEAEDASFVGPDGDSIEAWWYRPTNGAQDAVPLIVYYYGGSTPTLRRINTTHQFWAANGYAVLVVNPRGAHGYGDRFADWHAGDWGPAAAADILAGAEALLASHPEIDRQAIGCYGGSYGGFMTMYLVSHSDLFAAACAMYGIADLATYWGQGAWGWTYGDMALGGRTPWQHPEYFVGHSPVYAAGDVRAPLLLLHGAADDNVTPGESTEMFTALQLQGKPVEMVTFAGEGHGIAGSWENYVAHRTMMLEWFDRWLKGRGGAWGHRWDQ